MCVKELFKVYKVFDWYYEWIFSNGGEKFGVTYISNFKTLIKI